MRLVGRLWHGTLDLVLPPRCMDCGKAVERTVLLCVACDPKLRRLARDLCVLCQAAPPSETGLCFGCEVSGSQLDACVASVIFESEVEAWIHRFKYPKRGLRGLDPGPVAVARQLVVEAAGRAPGPRPDRVVPVPLHTSRLRARGFNPAALLARAVAREAGVRCEPVALVRTRATPSQTGLDRRERQRNVRGAFRVRRGWQPAQRIWLVDDVATTGATLREAARALRRAGARHVVAICAARTP